MASRFSAEAAVLLLSISAAVSGLKKAHFSDVVSSVMAALTVSKQQLGTKRSMKVGRERVTAIEIDTEIQRNKERDRWKERQKQRDIGERMERRKEREREGETYIERGRERKEETERE